MTKRKQSKGAKSSRRRPNPLERNMVKPGRPRIGFNGQDLNTVQYLPNSAIGSVTNRVGADWHAIDCSSTEGLNRAGGDVIKHYQEYKYASAALEWISATGPSGTDAAASVFIAYIDNPELIVTFKAATDINKFTIVRNVANCRSFNAWERFTYRVPLSYRRKVFNVDPTISTPGNEETDRAIQGIVVVAYNSISNTVAAQALGQFRGTATTRLFGFTASTLT